ncbi:MAG: hypothetical protein JEZ07_10090 [Phycisphaerae bacterium]|nr:hypothetical protein [Phycisphaerae bacterium]
MKAPSKTIQYYQLAIVTAVHFVADMFAGMLPVLMPAIRDHFQLENIRSGVLLVGISHLVMNISQMCVGHLRPDKKKPFMIFIGLGMVSVFTLIGFLPSAGPGMAWLLVVLIASMVGTGITHPESMRGLHLLKRTNASVGSALFMTGGHLGYGFGAWLSTIVVASCGLKGLVWFLPIIILTIYAVIYFRLRLATDKTKHVKAFSADMRSNSMPFWPMWLMLLPFCIGYAIFANVFPEFYKITFAEGESLKLGGQAAMALTIGGVVGGIWWSHWAQGRDVVKVSVMMMALGVPFMAYYIFHMDQKWTVWLLIPGFFFINAAFPLMATAARFAKGLTLGARMAIVSGGSWTIALSCYLALYPIINSGNLHRICKLSLLGYAGSISIGLYCIYRQHKINLQQEQING